MPIQSDTTRRSPSSNSGLVRDIIIGMSDGLTVPFALTAGLSGVLNTTHLIILDRIDSLKPWGMLLGDERDEK